MARRNRKGVLSRSKPSQASHQGGRLWASLTRSGLYDAPPAASSAPSDVLMSGSFTIIDMVNRLDPRTFRWIESSLAEQEFLGWTLDELRRKTFLEVMHPDDRARAEEAFRQALVSGEFLGLVVGIKTAAGKAKMIEVNAGARYGADQRVSHLRCHVADVTEKVRAERELRLRTDRADPGQRATAPDQPRARGAQGSLHRPLRERAGHVLHPGPTRRRARMQ